ncbi:MAG: hypothetical protein ACLQDV_12565 [Candidatus Binataceae bacterium]
MADPDSAHSSFFTPPSRHSTKSRGRLLRVDLCKTAEQRRMPQGVILSEVCNANEVDMASGFRTGSRKRSRYRFRVREALLSFATLTSSDRPSELTEPEESQNIFLQNEPNLPLISLDFFGFA